jgi:hypothetical protein
MIASMRLTEDAAQHRSCWDVWVLKAPIDMISSDFMREYVGLYE